MRKFNTFTTILFFLIYLSIAAPYTAYAQPMVVCNSQEVPSERILQRYTDVSGIDFAAYAVSNKVRNACSGENGIRLVFSTVYKGTSSPINATISLSSNDINYQIVSQSGLQNVINQNGELSGDFVFTNQENGCAEVLIAIPDANFAGDDGIKRFIRQELIVGIQNNTASSSIVRSFMLHDDAIFENFYHFFDNVAASDFAGLFTQPIFGFNPPTFMYFHNNLTIDQDFDLFTGFDTGDPEFNQYFGQNAGVNVLANNLLDIKGTYLTACQNNEWAGIVVQSGGEIELEKSWASRANHMLELNDNSLARVFDSRVFDCNYGMIAKGSALLTEFTNNTFENLDYGVYLIGATDVLLTPSNTTMPNNFRNIDHAGIYCASSTGIECMFNRFDNIAASAGIGSSDAAIKSENSSFIIANNQISNCSKGLSSLADKIYTASDNQMTGNVLGARIRHNQDVTSLRNNTITGKNGILFSYAYPHIDDNHINNDGAYPTESYGVRGSNSFYAAIRDNTIHSSDASSSVVMDNMGYPIISGNDIALLSQNEINGISINGGDGAYIIGNVVEAAQSPGQQSHGIVSSQAMSDILCNDIFSMEEGIVMKDNSIATDIKTNSLYDLGQGIQLAHSIIGEQKHNGNLFLGPYSTADIYAVEMNTDEVNFSKFIVDGAENALFLPAVVVSPNGDLVDDTNDPALTESCSGAVYTSLPKDRLASLCSIIWAINSSTTLEAVQKKNILTYYYKLILKYWPDKTKWPLCIRLFMQLFTGTNVEVIGKVAEKMTVILTPPVVSAALQTTADGAYATYLSDVSSGAESSTSRAAYYAAANLLDAAYPDRTVEQAALIAEIESELATFSATDDYEAAWLAVQSAWVKSYKGESRTHADEIAIETIASLCPLQYGDVVHGARALASEWSDIRYELTDCGSDEEEARIGTMPTIALVSPNPTNSMLNVSIGSTTAKVYISNLDGKIMHNSQVNKGESINVSYYKSGLYMITVTESDGQVKTGKFIKID